MSQSSNVVIVLTDKDDTNQMIIETSRDILSQKFKYFEKMFLSLREKEDDFIFIKVPNPIMAFDIITSSINNQTIIVKDFEPLYLLEFIKCQDFFGVEIDKTCLKDIKIDGKYFDLLLDVIDIVGYDDFTINIMINNLPDNYDFSKFPKELLNEINRLSNLYKIIYWTKTGYVHIIDLETGLTEDLYFYLKPIDNIYISDSGNVIVFSLRTEIFIYNIITKDKICIGLNITLNKCHVSKMGNYIALTSQNKVIIYHVFTNQNELKSTIIGEKHLDFRPNTQLCFSPDELYFIYNSGTNLNIIDLSKNLKQKNKLIGHNYDIKSICHSDNGFWICSSDCRNNIIIWSVKTGQIHKSISGHNLENKIISTKFINNDSQVLLKGHSFLALLEFKTGKIKQIYETNVSNTIIDYHPINNHIIKFQNNTIQLYDLNEDQITKSYSNGGDPIMKICIIPIINTDVINKIKYLVN
ncbi:WD40 domain protein [Saudi moumouvirus]|nr:WD40 domain protein [Saudi moumouvirus]